jgi:hypothetical protein
MGAGETQPAARNLERPPFQFSVRALFLLTFATALFFSVAGSIGYLDAFLVLAAIAFLLFILGYPRRAHPATYVVVALVGAALLWANLRDNGYQRRYLLQGPDASDVTLDPITYSMFLRGWPICPSMVCLQNLRTSHFKGDPTPQIALFIDGAVFVVAVVVVRFVCEWCVRKREQRGK